MSLIEQSELAPTQTAPAVIFLPEKTRLRPTETVGTPKPDMFQYSDYFWLRTHQDYDLFEDNFGKVLSTGINATGELVAIEAPDKVYNLGLSFDARGREKGRYVWQVSKATQQSRTIEQLTVISRGYRQAPRLEAIRYCLNGQGGLRAEQEMSTEEIGELVTSVRKLASSVDVENQIERYQARKQQAVAELGRYSVEWTNRHNPDKYKEEIKKRERIIKSIGFAALPLYQPPKLGK